MNKVDNSHVLNIFSVRRFSTARPLAQAQVAYHCGTMALTTLFISGE